MRCSARERERQLGAGYGFGIFVDNEFAGEINLNSVQRGSFQNAYVGYWIDEARAGQQLHARERRRAGPVRLRGAAPAPPAGGHHPPQRQQPPGDGEAAASARRAWPCATSRSTAAWEDHVRYAITSEEWDERRAELAAAWL